MAAALKFFSYQKYEKYVPGCVQICMIPTYLIWKIVYKGRDSNCK